MIENRRARFSSIDGLERDDLPLAFEVWVEDHFAAPWATRESMKLAQHFGVRYMASSSTYNLSLGELESIVQLNPEEARKTLAVMQSFGAIEQLHARPVGWDQRAAEPDVSPAAARARGRSGASRPLPWASGHGSSR